jgi:hypothetical protein
MTTFEALAAQGPDNSLDMRILPGTSRRDHNLLNVERFRSIPKRQAIDAVAVSDQETRR